MEPVTSAAAIVSAVNSDAGKTAGKLMERVLGRTADAIGDALGNYTEYRLRNVGQVLEKAEQKSRGRAGRPHPRVAHRILDDGSYVEDEVMAEYLSGVLASSLDESTDDRGTAWASLVSSMSTLQVRLHFILYREWAFASGLDSSIETGVDEGRRKLLMSADLQELMSVLGDGTGKITGAHVNHAVSGLARSGLLDRGWMYGPTDEKRRETVAWPSELWVGPAPAGMELYGWALGEPEFQMNTFGKLMDLPVTVDVPRLTRFALNALR